MLNTLVNGISNLSTRIIYAMYIVFADILLVHYLTSYNKEHYLINLLAFGTVCIAGPYILYYMSLYLEKFDEKRWFIALLIICFIVKLTWVLNYQIEPRIDYATFYNTGVKLSESFVIESRYVALFPHILGYSSFLSIFFWIFGASTLIPPILNVILSTISMAFIYLICKKISSVQTAIIASILWIILPSQTMFNMFALSEPLYSTILLAIWYVMIVIHERFKNISIKNLIIYSIILALLLALMNISRPIAVIPIIALGIWLFIINIDYFGKRKILIKKIIYILAIVISYFIFSSGTNNYMTARLGEEIATTPGYFFQVGLNATHNGMWNQEDSDLLYYYNDNNEGWTAEDVMQQMVVEAKHGLLNDDINFARLYYNKFIIFLGDDSAPVSYGKSVLDYKGLFTLLSNVFYFFLIAMSIIGMVIAFLKKNKTPLFFICIYTIGLTMAQMLVEVAPRYHYSATLSLVIMAAMSIHMMFKKKEDTNILE